MRTLLAILALSILPFFVLAQERLRIEVVPVFIYPVGTFTGDFRDYRMHPNVLGDSAPLIAVHRALDLHKWAVPIAYRFEVVKHDDIEILECTYAEPDLPSACSHYKLGGDQVLPFSSDQMANLHRSLGHETLVGQPTSRAPGTIRILIVIKADAFPWDSGTTVVGKAAVTSWNGWEPENMHRGGPQSLDSLAADLRWNPLFIFMLPDSSLDVLSRFRQGRSCARLVHGAVCLKH
ncbi:hypothetical protein [Candidatus Rariloculus sp.]|uniref:hypothetical protein n=1 Tax=Candidatus Rariloculus sp. TaxID=3101265 RepID=UPI003D0C5343